MRGGNIAQQVENRATTHGGFSGYRCPQGLVHPMHCFVTRRGMDLTPHEGGDAPIRGLFVAFPGGGGDVIQLLQPDQNVPGFGAVRRAQDAGELELVDDPRRPPVANAHPTLQ